jgi:hypothetical protein
MFFIGSQRVWTSGNAAEVPEKDAVAIDAKQP